MSENRKMHPAIAVFHLVGIERSVVECLFQAREGGARQKDLLAPTGVSQTSLSRSLAALTDLGVVEKSGVTKGARFALTSAARYWLTPPALRNPVKFDPRRIDDYVPNVTRWLPQELSKAIQASGEQPEAVRDTWRRRILETFLIDLSWASSSFEGNTYSLLDTEVLVKYGQEAEGKTRQESLMIIGHKHDIGEMVDMVKEGELTADMMSTLHGFLMRGLLDTAGKVWSSEIAISASAYRPSGDIPLIKQQLGSLSWKASKVEDPAEASFLLLAGTAYLQAFEDGNKRLGRLLASWPLLKAGLVPLSFVGIDKRSYTQGLLEFYELGSLECLAETVTAGYLKTSHAYQLEIRHQASETDGVPQP